MSQIGKNPRVRPFKFDPDKPVIVSVRFSPEEFETLIQIDQQAKLEGRTRSNMILQILKNWLEQKPGRLQG